MHRDLKPANILLGAYGEVYVVDWGLAKLYDQDIAPDAPVPEEQDDGEVAGTPYYMSPEQIRGENSQLGPGTDVFSLGVMLYRLLTGSFPFDADTVTALLLRVETEQAPDPCEVAEDREIPDPLAEAALEALSDDPEDRMSARELGERMTEYLEGIKEQRRRAERAEQLFDRARALHEAYLQTRQTVEQQRAELEEQLASLGPSDGLDIRRPIWEQQNRVDERAHEAEELYSKCVQATRESLELADNEPARRLLTDLYWYKYEEAREQRDEAKAVYFRSLVEEYDDGRYSDRFADQASLLIRLPTDADATLHREVSVGPLSELEQFDVNWSEMPTTVSTGTYRLRVAMSD
ncbi:MAG: serine/threonine-protein kinase, partial [Bradymonadaceae bacterium]